jgi:hypothetical protein
MDPRRFPGNRISPDLTNLCDAKDRGRGPRSDRAQQQQRGEPGRSGSYLMADQRYVCTSVPEVALIAGVALGAIISYGGHRHVVLAPRKLAHAART